MVVNELMGSGRLLHISLNRHMKLVKDGENLAEKAKAINKVSKAKRTVLHPTEVVPNISSPVGIAQRNPLITAV